MTARPHRPAATARTVPATLARGPLAWCPTCQAYRPAAQVPWDRMRRDGLGRITATYAAVRHTADGVPA